MRAKSEERRLAIMQAAAEVFHEQGFAGASMAAISARVGGSKATLYSYFTSKEALFIAVTLDAMDATSDALLNLLSGEVRDIRATLIEFGNAYLALLQQPDVVTTTRIGVSQGLPMGLAEELYKAGPERGWRFVSDAFERLSRSGALNIPDPVLAALQLKALLEAGVFEPMLFGLAPVVAPEIAVNEAIDTFLARFGVH